MRTTRSGSPGGVGMLLKGYVAKKGEDKGTADTWASPIIEYQHVFLKEREHMDDTSVCKLTTSVLQP